MPRVEIVVDTKLCSSWVQASRKRPDGGDLVPAEDEEMLLRELTAKLGSLPGNTAVVTELKTFFHFKGPTGHRLWRRVKDKLVKRACIREFDGIVAVVLPCCVLVLPLLAHHLYACCFRML